MAQYYTAVDVPQVTFEESDFKNYHSFPQQTLAVFLIVPWLTNWLGLHDALIRSSLLSLLGFRRPSAAKTLAGSLGGDQSGRINFSHSINEELARSDWMGLSGGDQSGRINSSDSIIEELARFALGLDGIVGW